MQRTLLALLLTLMLLPLPALAQKAKMIPTLDENSRREIINQAFEDFWYFAQKSNDPEIRKILEMQTLPIPVEHAYRIVENSVPFGLAANCGLQWRKHYELYLQNEPNVIQWDKLQMAFINSLMATTQRLSYQTLRTRFQCTPEVRAKVQEGMDAALEVLEKEVGEQ